MAKTSKAFVFLMDKERIKATYKLPAAMKLAWLEEANDFIAKAVPKKKLRAWEKIKSGSR